jgi:sugar lactone lactonase YvrE
MSRTRLTLSAAPVLVLLAATQFPSYAQFAPHEQIIETVAGNGQPGYSGDGKKAVRAELDHPVGVVVDFAGNLHFADAQNDIIRKVEARSGIISTVVGAAFACGASGDGGLAKDALLCSPEGVTFDRHGNLYIADAGNARIGRVDARTQIITTVAGNGTQGYSGDGGLATDAELFSPGGVAFDAGDNLFIADDVLVKRVDARTGIITTVTGLGSGTDGGLAVDAAIGLTFSILFDRDGNLLIADSIGNKVHRVDRRTGIMTAIAGNGTAGFSGDGGPAINAQLAGPFGITLDAEGNLFIADFNNQRIRRVERRTGIIDTVAGNGVDGFSGDYGPPTEASFSSPSDLVFDGEGRLYISDQGNNRVRRIQPRHRE